MKEVSKTEVITNIQPGPSLPRQKQLWERLWGKLISAIQDEVKSDSRINPETSTQALYSKLEKEDEIDATL